MADRLPENAAETWKNLWEDSYHRYYQCYFHEIEAEYLINFWTRVDVICKIVLAFSASGSAISGWFLWQQPGFKTCWAVIAGFSAIVAIVHTALSVADRIKEATSTYTLYRSFRNSFDSFRTKMKTTHYNSLKKFKQEFGRIVDNYRDTSVAPKPDVLLTEKRKDMLQKLLNKRLGL